MAASAVVLTAATDALEEGEGERGRVGLVIYYSWSEKKDKGRGVEDILHITYHIINNIIKYPYIRIHIRILKRYLYPYSQHFKKLHPNPYLPIYEI